MRAHRYAARRDKDMWQRFLKEIIIYEVGTGTGPKSSGSGTGTF